MPVFVDVGFNDFTIHTILLNYKQRVKK